MLAVHSDAWCLVRLRTSGLMTDGVCRARFSSEASQCNSASWPTGQQADFVAAAINDLQFQNRFVIDRHARRADTYGLDISGLEVALLAAETVPTAGPSAFPG